MREHLPIILIVLAFVSLATLYNVVTPVGEGPDEPGHWQYVLFLAREGRLPVQCAAPCHSDVPGAGHHPPLAYMLAAPLIVWLPPEERVFDFPGNRRFTWAGGTQVNALAHGTRERWSWAPEVWAWRMGRAANTLAGAATVVFTYLAARVLDFRMSNFDFRFTKAQARAKVHNPQSTIALLAAALLAFNPQFIFVSALVNNDALLAALGATLLWLVMRQWQESAGSAFLPAALVGLALGLALLTKQSALVLVPVALGWAVTSATTKRLMRGGVVVVVAALVAGWWYARNWQLYGDAFGLNVFRAEFATQPFDVTSPSAWVQALAQLYASSWARFGWLNVVPPAWVDRMYLALGLVALVGLLARWPMQRSVVSFYREHRPDDARGALLLLAGLPLLAFGWVLSFALAAGLVAWQGRLLFPAAAALAVLGAVGVVSCLVALTRPQRPGQQALQSGSWLLATGCCLLAMWLPFGVIRPAYPNPALTETEALAALGNPVYTRFARTDEAGAALRGWQVAGEARPGAMLEVALTWHALGRQNRDWWVFVHVVDGSGQIVAETNAEVGGEVFPMLQWVAGDWMVDRQTVTLPPDLPPGTYSLRFGLWYPETGRRARVYADGGTLLGDQLVLTTIVIER